MRARGYDKEEASKNLGRRPARTSACMQMLTSAHAQAIDFRVACIPCDPKITSDRNLLYIPTHTFALEIDIAPES